MSGGVSRRGLLTGAFAAVAGSVVAREPLVKPAGLSTAARSLRVAFVSDVHLDTTTRAARGFANCLKQIAAMEDEPDLIIQGGDIIMDGLNRDANSVERQYSWAKEILKRHSKLPIEHVIGNHDVWGWSRRDKAAIENDPRYGKRWWLSWTGCTSTYRSFDQN